jgi:hypothetical protein
MIRCWCKTKRCLIPDSKAAGYCHMVRHCKNLVLMNRKSKHKDRRSRKQLQLLERRNRHKDRWNQPLAERRITIDEPLPPSIERY